MTILSCKKIDGFGGLRAALLISFSSSNILFVFTFFFSFFSFLIGILFHTHSEWIEQDLKADFCLPFVDTGNSKIF